MAQDRRAQKNLASLTLLRNRGSCNWGLPSVGLGAREETCRGADTGAQGKVGEKGRTEAHGRSTCDLPQVFDGPQRPETILSNLLGHFKKCVFLGPLDPFVLLFHSSSGGDLVSTLVASLKAHAEVQCFSLNTLQPS